MVGKAQIVLKEGVLGSKADVIKYHKLGGLKQQNVFSYSSGGQKFKIKV